MAVASLVVILSRGAPWRHEWARTLDTLGGTTIFLGPVVAVAAALLAADSRRQRDLVDSSPRGWAAGLRSSAVAAAAGLAVLLLVGLAMVVLDAAVGSGGPVTLWPLATGVVSLGLYAATGALVATKKPLVLVVLLVGPLTFLVGAVCAAGALPNFLRFGPTGGSLAGLTWDVPFALLQIATMLGLTGACLAGTVSSSGHRRQVLEVLLGALVVTLAGLALLGWHGDQRFRPSSEQPDRCAGQRPTICVAASNEVVLPQVVQQTDRLTAGLTSAGAVVPDAFDQELPASRPGGRPLFSLAPDANTKGFSSGEAALLLSRPAACPAYYADVPPPDSVFVAQQYLQAYLLAAAGEQVDADDQQLSSWLRSPTTERRAWVKTVYAQLTVCELDTVRPPAG